MLLLNNGNIRGSPYAFARDRIAAVALLCRMQANEAMSRHMQNALDLQVNKIRQSLQLVARNSTAFGLHQPHMERTKLCELGDEQLDRQYIEQRSQLRELVQQLAKPKRVNGKVMTGPGLAELVSQMVTALNSRDIPTAGSILEHFNKELVYRWEPCYPQRAKRAALYASDVAFANTYSCDVDFKQHVEVLRT